MTPHPHGVGDSPRLTFPPWVFFAPPPLKVGFFKRHYKELMEGDGTPTGDPQG